MTGNLEHSVRDRLKNIARASDRPFQECLQYYGLERFLYRLAQSPHREKFLLKGALVLRVWDVETSRATRDIDLLGFVDAERSRLTTMVREACELPVEPDGLDFAGETITAAVINDRAEYQGTRVTFTGFLGRTRIPMQIDIGFGDVVHPVAELRPYPSMLGLPAPVLRMVPRETVIAEKFEAIVALGATNSRMKDFYDIWLLSRRFDFEGAVLAEAISRTFQNRGTAIDTDPAGLSETYTTSPITYPAWAAFLRKANLRSAPGTLEEIRIPLRQFLLPIAEALVANRRFVEVWRSPGPWR